MIFFEINNPGLFFVCVLIFFAAVFLRYLVSAGIFYWYYYRLKSEKFRNKSASTIGSEKLMCKKKKKKKGSLDRPFLFCVKYSLRRTRSATNVINVNSTLDTCNTLDSTSNTCNDVKQQLLCLEPKPFTK